MTQNASTKRQFATLLCTTLSASLLLTACGGDSNDDSKKNNTQENAVSAVKLLADPMATQTFTATQLAAIINAAGLNAATPVCGVMVEYINHSTTGLKGETTNATGAVMIPTGDDPKCQGKRPISLYAHGTSTQKSYNLAALNDSDNPAYETALLLAATTAAQGDIVIAPNYPGYDKSELDYAPYVTKQQGIQTVDALKAGKLALKKLADESKINVTASDKLFVSGYSQGGYVALATAQALDHQGIAITAISPGSGPYSLAAFADAIVGRQVNVGGTAFLPLLVDSLEAEYGGIQKGIYAGKYAETAPSLLPADVSFEELVKTGKLPQSNLFAATSDADKMRFGFGENYLVNTDYRVDYLKDMQANPDGLFVKKSNPEEKVLPLAPLKPEHNLRKALRANDLRTYAPKSPTLLCGANQDPMVFFDVNTTVMTGLWKGTTTLPFAMIDLDVSNKDIRAEEETPKVPYVSTLPTIINTPVEAEAQNLQTKFTTQLGMMITNASSIAYRKALGDGATEEQAKAKAEYAAKVAVAQKYHTMAMPYCLTAANTFFDQYR